MANQQRKITYGINFEVNDSELKQLKKRLQEFQNITVRDFASAQGKSKTTEEMALNLNKLKKQAQEVQRVMRLAYNPQTNTYNIAKFNAELAKSGINIRNFRKEMSKTAAGRAVINAQTHELTKFNTELKQSHKLLDSLGKTLANTIKWTISSSLMQGVTRSISQAYGFAKNLDGALNDIRIVTGKSADEMTRFAERANAVASNLGKGTNDYTRAALIYAQQGLGQKEIEEKTAITLKTANVTGQSAEEVSEELTAVWNGYKVSAAQAELYVDRLAAVASTTASNLQELSTGMSKVASAAASLGVGEDQLAAQLSTIISVTRQAPETVGTALRTVYARITDIQAGLDEDGVTLGKYSGDMAKIGINVLDLNGNLRNMGEVMEEIGNKWSTMTKEQKIYLAQTMAGQRQYSNLTALFDNFDKYKSALNTAQNAEGKLQEQQDIYMDRLSTHVQQLTTTTEHMWMGLTDTDGFKDIIDNLTTIVEKVDKLFRSIGGGKNLLQSLVPIVMSLTSKTVASGINTMISNAQLAKRQKEGQLQSKKMAEIRMKQLQGQGQKDSQVYKVNAQKAEFFSQPIGSYSKEQMEQINARWNASLDAATEADLAQEKLNSGAYLVKSAINQNILEGSVTEQQKQKYAAQAEEYYAKISESLRDQLLERERNRKKQEETQKQEAAELQQQLKDQTQLTIIYNQQLQQAKKYQTQYKQALNNVLQAYKNQNNIIKQLQVDIGNKKSELKNLQINSQLYHTKYITPIKQLHGLDSKQRDLEYKSMEDIFKKNQEYNQFSERFQNNGNSQTFKAALTRATERDNLLQQLNADRVSRGGTQISNFQQLEKTYGFMFDQTSGKMKDFGSVMQQVAQTMLNYNKQISDANRTIATLTQQLQQRKSGRLPELARVNSVGAAQTQANRDAANTKAQLIESYKNMQNKYELSFDRKNDPNFSILTEVRKKGIEVPRELAQLRSEYKTLTRQVQTYNSSIKPMLKRGYEDNLGDRKSQLQASISGFLEKFKNYLDTQGSEVKTNIKDAQNQRKDAQATVNKNLGDNNFEKQQQQRQVAIQSLIQLTSGMSQVTAGFQSLMKIGDIWSDNTITTTEKISQSFSNLLFNLPMMLTGIVSIVKALKNFDSITELLNTKLTLNLKLKLQHLATNAKLLISTITNNVANLGFAGTLKLLAAKFKEVAASAATTQMTLGAFLIVIAAVAAAILLIKSAAQKNSKQAQATIEQNKKLIEQEKEKQDLLANQKNMIDQLKEINKQYQDGSISRAQLKDKINELEEKYKDESDTIRKLTQDYNNLTDAIKNAQENYDQEKLESDKRIADAKANIAKNTEQGEVKGGEWWRAADLGQLNARARGDTVIQVGIGETEFGQKLRTELQGRQVGKGQGKVIQSTILGGLIPIGPAGIVAGYQLGKNSLTQVNINDIQTKQQLKKVVQGLQAAVDIATEEDKNTATYNSTIQLLTSLQKQLEEWEDADLAVLNDLAVISAKNVKKNFNNIDDFDEYQKAYQKSSQQIYNDLKDNKDFISKTTEEKNKIIAQKLEAIIPDDLKEKYSTKMDAINKINHEHGINDTNEEIIQLINNLSEEQLKAFLKIDNKFLPTLQDTKRVLQDIAKIDLTNIEFNSADLKEAVEMYNNLANAIEKLKSGKSFSVKEYEETFKFLSDDEINSFFRLGLQGYELKDESNRDIVAKLIAERQRDSFYTQAIFEKANKEEAQNWKKENIAQNYSAPNWWNAEDETNKTNKVAGSTIFSIPVKDILLSGASFKSEENVNNKNAQILFGKLKNITDNETQKKVVKWQGLFNEDGKLKGDIDKDTYEEMMFHFDKLAKKYKDVDSVIQEAENNIKQANKNIHDSIFPKDEDIDDTLVAKLGEQYRLTAQKSDLLNDKLSKNSENAKKLATATNRYIAGFERFMSKSTEWKTILQTGSTSDLIKILPDLKNTFADILDISEDSLSDTFVTTTENAELLNKALMGDSEAYDILKQKAFQDIMLHIGVEDEDLQIAAELIDGIFGETKDEIEKAESGTDLLIENLINPEKFEEDCKKLVQMGIDTQVELEAIFSHRYQANVDLIINKDGSVTLNSAIKEASYEVKSSETDYQAQKIKAQKNKISNHKTLTKYLKDERDIYHEINILLKDQERILSRLTKNQDKMYGKELLKNLKEESKQLNKQNKLLKTKQSMQQSDLKNKKSSLSSKYGAAFDSSGNILNYTDLITQATNNVNSIISRERGIQNAMNAWTDAGKDTNDNYYQQLQNELNKISIEKDNANTFLNDIKSDLNAYESVKSAYEDNLNEQLENAYKQIEIRFKTFDLQLQLSLDLSKIKEQWSNFKRQVLEHDDIFNTSEFQKAQKDIQQNFEKIGNLGQKLTNMNLPKSITETIEMAKRFDNPNYDVTKDETQRFKTQGQARQYLNQLLTQGIDTEQQMLELQDAIKQSYLDQYQILQDLFSIQQSRYSFIDEQLTHNKDLINMIFGEENYNTNNMYYEKMLDNNLKSLKAANIEVTQAKERLQKEIAEGNEAGIRKAQEMLQSAEQKRYQIASQYIQKWQEKYVNAINQVYHQMEMKLTNGKGLTYLDTQWDLIKKKSNLYLDDVNSAFGIKNTEYLYNQAINDTKLLSSQQKLKKVMNEQLNILKEKDKLTQYDVDRAQKILEVEKARIALEQAQNNKTKMRLKRDSQGNYSYQYVANQDDIAEAENKLAKAQNDLYNFDKENTLKNYEQAWNAYKEWSQKKQALEIEFENASEDRQKQIIKQRELLDKQYYDYIESLSTESQWSQQNLMNSAIDNYTTSLGTMKTEFFNMSDAQKNKWLNEMIPQINSGIADVVKKFATDPDSLKQMISNTTEVIDKKRQEYQDGIAKLKIEGGYDLQQLKENGYDPILQAESQLITDNSTLITQASDIVTAMDDTLDSLDNVKSRWADIYTNTKNALSQASKYIELLTGQSLDETTKNNDNPENSSEGGGNITVPTSSVNFTNFANTIPDITGTKGGNPLDSEKGLSPKEKLTKIFDKYFSNSNFNYKDKAFQTKSGAIDWGKVKTAFNKFVKDDPSYHMKFMKWLESQNISINELRKYNPQNLPISLKNPSFNPYSDIQNPIDINKVKQKINSLAKKIIPNVDIFSLLSRFDTGGYTGDWSSSQGKLAILHQKELVLNKQDTANMLEMIQMVREMQQNELQFRLSSLNNEIQDVMKQNAQVEKIKTQQQLLEQSVSISASFPSVNSKKEIEEALSELMNKATQIALKYKKN